MRLPTAKVAFAAYLHDLGKLAERARIEVNTERLETHVQMYCPHYQQPGTSFRRPSHKHAAYTAIAWDEIESTIPDLVKGDMYPFASRQAGEDKTDSIVNASAMHHRPETFLQWIIATADRVASGFERETFERYNQVSEDDVITPRQTGKNHYQARLLTLVEQIQLTGTPQHKNNENLDWCYPLAPLSPQAIFPDKREAIEPADNTKAQEQYRQLWDGFTQALKQIPSAHQKNWDLWLDHFDTLWQTYAQAIPSATAFGVKPEVSLYDHSKTTAALAAALWRWHEAYQQTDEAAAQRLKERADWEEKKILLIQGDFFGIQNFIFAQGNQTNKAVAKLLRGRSFQVSLFAELAALKVLQACDLPSTSQILNAAGKFMIVAPNTEEVRAAVEQARVEINQWFLTHSFGQVSLGLAMQAASCNDFVEKKRFADLVKQSFSALEQSKLQRFDLLSANTATVLSEANYQNGVCSYNQQLPADDSHDGWAVAKLSLDQIRIGELLTKRNRLMVLTHPEDVYQSGNTQALKLAIFGYTVAFTDSEEITGRFGALADNGHLVRCWDFSLPKLADKHIWQGYARRYINAYVPKFTEPDIHSPIYDVLDDEERAGVSIGQLKTLNHLACEDRDPKENIGKVALAVLKGDVDNLGLIFQKGLAEPTFAKMAALSRQMNMFFGVWLPAYCQDKYPNTYTVFAGGDDFFMIGPWRSTQRLVADMRTAFTRYMAENSGITFSCGISVTKPGLPLPRLSLLAEEALDAAKAYRDDKRQLMKNAICLYQQTVSWSDWVNLEKAYTQIDEMRKEYQLSSAYVYSLITYVKQEASGDPRQQIWRSHFYYRTSRLLEEKKNLDNTVRKELLEIFVQSFCIKGILEFKNTYLIPLFNHLYMLRER